MKLLNKVLIFLKNNFRYILVFLLAIAIYEFFGFGMNYGDPISNYGFSYAIANGQVPYLEFNTVSTPLFAFYASIVLRFWNNYLMFLIEQAILVTITFYFLYKLYDKKSYLVLAILIGLNFYGILATYNFMCFSMLVIILYLEEKHSDKDYLIGFFIGLAILSKHTVGCFFIIPTLIKYFSNWRKILKRALGCLVPCSLFLIYLLVKGAMGAFIDLCFLGLFDFSSSNNNYFNNIFFLCCLFLILAIYLIYKNWQDIKNYYLILTFFFCIPIFDLAHFVFFCASVMMMMLPYLRWKNKYNIVTFLLISFLSLISSLMVILDLDIIFSSKFEHFEYTLLTKKIYKNNLKVNEFLDSYSGAIVLSYYTMQYDIIKNNKLDYYDVLMNGNFGYDGINKMIKRLSLEDSNIFIVSMSDYNDDYSYSQFSKDIVDYVILNGKLIESKYGYNVYYIE
ncbi:MAG: hypothetical protein PUC82_03950 [bacterium]|nr:hypothetical protein [bacterium]